MKVPVLLILGSLLAGCVQSSDPFVLRGQITEQASGSPIAQQELHVIRIYASPEWCSFCSIKTEEVATVRSDENGHYWFTGELPGDYSIHGRAESNPACVAQGQFNGVMGGKEYKVDLVMPSAGNCILLM